MTFPVHLNILGHRLHPHTVLEVIAYSTGFQLYRVLRRRFPRAAVPFEQNLWIFVGAVFGALIGSKLLAWVESLPDYWPHRFEPAAWMGGKTIVGGLLGGWVGVEIAKKRLGITRSTGDAFVFPLALGMAIGRVGCFLTGLDDHTYGTATSLPWGVNFGDGIYRHPTQLYDIVFLIALSALLALRLHRTGRPSRNSPGGAAPPMHLPQGHRRGATRLSHPKPGATNTESVSMPDGQLFRLFILAYLLWRFAVEFIKPTWKPYLGLSAIQLASLLGAIVCVFQLFRMPPPTEVTIDEQGTAAASFAWNGPRTIDRIQSRHAALAQTTSSVPGIA